MLVDEKERLGEDQWLDDLVERLGDDRIDLCLVPPGHQIEHLIARPLEVVLVCAEKHVGDLRDTEPYQRAPSKEPRLVQRATERQRRRSGDDRLVEVEECCCGHRCDCIGAGAVRRYPIR